MPVNLDAAETEAAAPPITTADPSRALAPGRFQLAEHKFNVFHVVPEPGTPFETLLQPAYWAHNAIKLSPWDQIVVNYEGSDGAYFARLLVRSTARMAATLHVLEHHDLDAVDRMGSAPLSEYEVKYSDPHNRYCVFRRQDGERVSEGHQTRTDAERWIQTSAPRLTPRNAA